MQTSEWHTGTQNSMFTGKLMHTRLRSTSVSIKSKVYIFFCSFLLFHTPIFMINRYHLPIKHRKSLTFPPCISLLFKLSKRISSSQTLDYWKERDIEKRRNIQHQWRELLNLWGKARGLHPVWNFLQMYTFPQSAGIFSNFCVERNGDQDWILLGYCWQEALFFELYRAVSFTMKPWVVISAPFTRFLSCGDGEKSGRKIIICIFTSQTQTQTQMHI